MAEEITWPTVPDEIAGTDAAKPWIEGRDAAVAAFSRALNEMPPELLQAPLVRAREKVAVELTTAEKALAEFEAAEDRDLESIMRDFCAVLEEISASLDPEDTEDDDGG